MNRAKRGKLAKALEMINDAASIIKDVRDDEIESMNNLPESLQESVLYQGMEDAVDNLDEALDDIESAKEGIERASNGG